MKSSRLTRLIELIVLLQSGRSRNAQQLAAECGVSRRTVFRDLDLLRQAGVPLLFDDDRQQYRMSPDVLLPPTSFSPDEALSLLLLCHELGGDRSLPFLSSAHRAALKLESNLPRSLREYLQEVGPHVRIRFDPRNRLDGQESTYQLILQSISQRRSVRISYESFSDPQPVVTKLHPYQLLFSRRSWYVIGRSSSHRSVRTFNLARISAIEALDEPFDRPKLFNLDRLLRNAWHLIAEPGPDVKVRVRFEPLVARNVAEVVWHKTQEVEMQPDGGCIFSVLVSGFNEMSWWILGYGDQATVLEPPELRELMARRVSVMAERYGCQPGSSGSQ